MLALGTFSSTVVRSGVLFDHVGIAAGVSAGLFFYLPVHFLLGFDI